VDREAGTGTQDERAGLKIHMEPGKNTYGTGL
jgi:hypothetical protein